MSSYINGSDVLGASGLKNQYIVIRVKDIDAAALEKKLKADGNPAAAFAALGTKIANVLPKAVLDIGLPAFAKTTKQQWGVDADVYAVDATPGDERPKSEFLPGVGVGALVGVAGSFGLFGIYKLVAYLVRK